MGHANSFLWKSIQGKKTLHTLGIMDPRSQWPSWFTKQFISTISNLNKLKFMQWFGRKRRLNFWINWLGNGVEESKKERINNALHPVIQQISMMSQGVRIWLMIN